MSSVWMNAYACVSSPSPRSNAFWLAPQNLHLPSAHVCSVRSNQTLPVSLAKPVAIEWGPLACFEQYKLRRASRLVRRVVPIPNTLLCEDVIDALLEVRNLGGQPFVRRLVISRRNTPDFVNGSRNLTELSAQSSLRHCLPPRPRQECQVSRLANSGGVNTSSLERLAMQVKMSGLRPRIEKLAWPFISPIPSDRPSASKQDRAQSSADIL